MNKSSAVGAGDSEGQPHPLVKLFLEKLIKFGKIWLDLGKIEAKFGQK